MSIVLTGLPAIRRLVCRTSGDDTPMGVASLGFVGQRQTTSSRLAGVTPVGTSIHTSSAMMLPLLASTHPCGS